MCRNKQRRQLWFDVEIKNESGVNCRVQWGLERIIQVEMSTYFAYEKHSSSGNNRGISYNSSYEKKQT